MQSLKELRKRESGKRSSTLLVLGRPTQFLYCVTQEQIKTVVADGLIFLSTCGLEIFYSGLDLPQSLDELPLPHK